MRDANELKGIDGMQYLASAPKGEIFISLVAKDDAIYAATDKHIYKLVGDKRLEKLADDTR